MEIIVDSYKSKVRIKNKLIYIETNENLKNEFSPLKIKKLLISTHTTITGEVINTCIKHNIDLIFLDEYSNPISRIWNNKFGSISTIRRKQIEIFQTKIGYNLIINWQIEKIKNMFPFLDENSKSKLNKYITKIEKINTNCNINLFRKQILNYESKASNIIFKNIIKILPNDYRVQTREKKNATTPYNCILNYSFAIIYNYLENELIKVGLDPSIGILHIDNYNKKPLVYDLIEKYRYLGYKVSLKVVNNIAYSETNFIHKNNVLFLNKNIILEIRKFMKIELDKEQKNIKKYLHKIAKSLLSGDINGLCC